MIKAAPPLLSSDQRPSQLDRFASLRSIPSGANTVDLKIAGRIEMNGMFSALMWAGRSRERTAAPLMDVALSDPVSQDIADRSIVHASGNAHSATRLQLHRFRPDLIR